MVQHLRKLMLRGKLPPGARLPTYEALKQRFRTDSPTIRDAMAVLRTQGFIETHPRSGTFVVPHPPHLSHYALSFPFDPERAPSQFFTALRAEADKCQRPERHLSCFFNVEEHTDVEDYQRLLGLVKTRRVAGLIFAANPYLLRRQGSPLISEPDLPRVVIEAVPELAGVPSVYPDICGFVLQALDDLAARGRRRAALLIAGSPGGSWSGKLAKTFVKGAAARQMTVREHWIQGVAASLPESARSVMHLLMHPGHKERPDGLVIADDNLVQPATAGLVAAGVKVPQELEVVAHTNFPWPTPSAVPVQRLGYDIGALLALCLERIEQQRRGEPFPRHTMLPPLWEAELTSGS